MSQYSGIKEISERLLKAEKILVLLNFVIPGIKIKRKAESWDLIVEKN